MFEGTAIVAIKAKNGIAIAGDGQVTMGNGVIMKHRAVKVRRLFKGEIVAGFAGSVADALLFLSGSK